MERKRILVAFGDLRGFRRWLRRVVTTPEESEIILDQVYQEWEKFALSDSWYIKYAGDGIVAIKELKDGYNRNLIHDFLKKVAELSTVINQLVTSYYPPMSGYRMRAASGYAFKRMTLRKVGDETVSEPEFIESVINMCRDLLYVKPEIPTICHGSSMDIPAAKKKEVFFTRIKNIVDWPISLDKEDVEDLWFFSLDEKAVKNLEASYASQTSS